MSEKNSAPQRDAKARTKRRVAAIIITAAFIIYVIAILAAVLSGGGGVPWLLAAVLGVGAALLVGGIILALRERLQEISKGEEDEARKY